LAESLPDYGVIVQMEVAPPREPVTKKTGQAEKPRPPSRWERTRQRLAGDEKQTAFERSMCSSCHDADVRHYGGKGHNDYDGDGRVDLYVDYAGGGHPAPTRKQLIEQLIETLAENGHNLRNLSANDQVTLSVSWQQPAAVPDPYRALKGYFYQPSGKNNADDKSKTGEPASPTSPANEGADSGGGSSPRSSAELSGDLLLAKGQFAEAAKSFQQALDGLRAAGDDGPSKKEARERALTLKLAYARAHSTVQPEGAPTATTAHQQLTAVSEYEKLLTTYAPRQSPRRPEVAGRLSVTATKRQLEDVAAGKLSREQFAQQVQTRGFHPAAAK
jgi:hypothetical protein